VRAGLTPRGKPAALRPAARRVLAAALALVSVGVCAHGDWPPRFGGVMNDGGETSFELVRAASGIVAHVSDHGEPLDVTGSAPELQIRRGGRKVVVDGRPRGTAIVFPGVRLMVGDEVALKLVTAGGSIAFGRFTPPAVTTLASRSIRK